MDSDEEDGGMSGSGGGNASKLQRRHSSANVSQYAGASDAPEESGSTSTPKPAPLKKSVSAMDFGAHREDTCVCCDGVVHDMLTRLQ